jgi:chemotaxis signal transduction protein
MDLINFKVGYKTISLKILDILLTEQFNNNLTVLPNDNKSFLGVKDYMGIPTPVFDLGIILNGVSTERSNLDALKQLKSWQKQLIAWFKR